MLKTIVGTTSVGLLLWLARETCPHWAAITIVLVPAVFGLFPYVSVRSLIFTNLFFAVTLFTIQRVRSGRYRAAFLFPLVMALWTNLHGGFPAGLGILGVVAACDLVEAAWRRDRLPWALPVVALAGAAATMLSPYGPSYLRTAFAFGTMSRAEISEWQPFHLGLLHDTPTFAAIPLLIGMAVLAIMTSRRVKSMGDLVLLTMTGLLALWHVRHSPFFLLTCLWLLPGYLAASRWMPKSGSRFGFLVFAVAAELACVRTFYAWQAGWHLSVPADAFPVQAMEFMRDEGVTGNVAVDFNWGSYLIGTCYPSCLVSFDGRLEEVFPAHLRALSFALQDGTAGWDRLLVDYPTDIVLLPVKRPGVNRIAATPGWTLVYRDSVAALFVRNTPRFAGVIERHGGSPASAAPVDDRL